MSILRIIGLCVLGFVLLANVVMAQEQSADASVQEADRLTKQAETLAKAGNLKDAEPLFDRALGLYEKAYGGSDGRFLNALGNQSTLRASFGMDRESVLVQIVEVCREVHGPFSREMFAHSRGLAWYYGTKKKYADSERLAREALAIWGKIHQGNIDAAVGHLVDALLAQGKHQEVEKVQLSALKMLEEAYGVDDHEILPTLIRLIDFYAGSSRPEEVTRYSRRVWAIVETLPEAVDMMGFLQLDTKLPDSKIDAVFRFLTSLSDLDRTSATPPSQVKSKARLVPPDPDRIPENAQGDLIRHGRALFSETCRLLGPEVENEKMRYTGNVMACGDCHQENGSKPCGLSLIGTARAYPSHESREDATLSLEDRINGCVQRGLNGIPLPKDGREMKAIVAYLRWLGEDASGDFGERGIATFEIPEKTYTKHEPPAPILVSQPKGI